MALSFQMLTDVAVTSHSAAALAFLLLGVLLLTGGKGQLQSRIVACACLLTAAWAGTLAVQLAFATHFLLISETLEVLRNFGWTVCLLLLLGYFQHANGLGLKKNTTVAAIGLFYLIVLASTVTGTWQYDHPISTPAFVLNIVVRVASAVLGLLLVEQLYRNTPPEQRWGIKFACLGIGVLFVYDFYMYSDALMFRHVNGEIWAARGLVNALSAPVIAISLSRNRTWPSRVAVSRHILFHSAALFGAALYLLLMASAGYYLRFFGGNWGSVLQVAFLVGSGILLIGILFSGAFRSRLRVFVSKHFYNYNYDYREEWKRFTRILSEEGPDLAMGALQAMAKLVESPGGAAFTSRELGGFESIATWNMSITSDSETANISLHQFLEQKQWVIDLQEYQAFPGRYDYLALPGWLRNVPRAWLVIPLILQGKLRGIVVLAQPRSPLKLNWEITDLLKIAGSQAASYLAQRESAAALTVARQFESFNRMSTFVVHDIKNLVSQLSLLITNSEKHKHNPEFQEDMMDTINYSVQKMKLLLQKLSRRDSIERKVPLRIEDLLQQAVNAKSNAEPRPELQIIDAGLIVFADWERLERVIGHLIQNGIEATPKDGKVTISIVSNGGRAAISIADSGHGMSMEFIRDRLFRPFDSTKSAGMGIGVFESREYIHELGGEIEVVSHVSVGTTFRISLPLHNVGVERLQEETSEPE